MIMDQTLLPFMLRGVQNPQGDVDDARLQKLLDQAEFNQQMRHLAERKFRFAPLLRSYLTNKNNPGANETLLGELYDNLNIGSGNRNGLAKQFFCRDVKTRVMRKHLEDLLEKLLLKSPRGGPRATSANLTCAARNTCRTRI